MDRENPSQGMKMEGQNNHNLMEHLAVTKEEQELEDFDMEVYLDEGPEAAYGEKEKPELYTKDGTVNRSGRPAIKCKSGGWKAAGLILVNQVLAIFALYGVWVNLVLFLTRVLRESNAPAANDVSKWIGTLYLFSLVGAFLSDSYWGRYKTSVVFQVIFLVGLVLLALSTYLFLLKPAGCGDVNLRCEKPSFLKIVLFYISLYTIALGYGGYQPSIVTFGADQFDEEDAIEGLSKVAYFSWFYLALDLGCLFPNTILAYFEDTGNWLLGFWMSTGSAALALIIFLAATPSYRHFRPGGNPIPRFSQVFVAAIRKWNVRAPSHGDKLYELPSKESAIGGSRKILHSEEFRFLDKAATATEDDITSGEPHNLWRLCSVSQVEEVKCILRMLPIWLCTIIYSAVFTQMASLFVEQGAAMKTNISGFHIPPAAMSMFTILCIAACIVIYMKVLVPCAIKVTGNPNGFTEFHRMGVGLILALFSMVAAGVVELYRLRIVDEYPGPNSLGILWQTPQYALIGASEAFMYVGQLEFFNGQAPEGLRSFGSALWMTSIAMGNYVSSLIVTIVMDITTRDNKPGWIPEDLNRGHMDRFCFLLAFLTVLDFIAYVICARRYRGIARSMDNNEDDQHQKV
jgi:peptide/histidine transporter 3/4